MASEDMSVEQARPIIKEEQVAERWMRVRGVQKPLEEHKGGGFFGKLAETIKGLSASKENPTQLVTEAYDLFVEKQVLQDDIARKQRELMEPKKAAQPLSLEQKRELIKQGKISAIISSISSSELSGEVIARSQTRTKELDTRLDQIFGTPGMYEKFHEDLTHQLRIRHQAREVRSLERFEEQIDLLAIKLAREAQVQGRTLTTAEKQLIDDNKILKQDATNREQELLKDPEVFEKVRILELLELKRQLRKDRFGQTRSRKVYLRRIMQYWAEAKKVLLTGETGTGKTELYKIATRLLFGTNPEYVTGHRDMSIYELLGKTGFRVQEGDVFRPAPLIRAMTGRDGKGIPFLLDELDRAPNQAIMGIKTVLNARPGEKGLKIQTDSAGSFDVGEEFAVGATANIKSEKHTTATELDPAIVRVFDAPMDVDYIPAPEVYDLTLATLMDSRGGIPLSETDARRALKNLCDAASWIQDAYQGRKIVTDPSVGGILEARGQASTGRSASLKKALLDPGRTLDMLSGWTAAQVSGVSFEEYLNQRIIEFINNRAYPDEDRYYLTEIFALKGFLRGHSSIELMVTDLTQQTLDTWSGATSRREVQKDEQAYLPANRVARLDPYRRFKRPVSIEAEDLLGEDIQDEELIETESDESGVVALERAKWHEVLGSRVEVKPLPSYVTPEIRRNLEAFGFEMVWLPPLELGTLTDLKRVGESHYLDDLQRRYPLWKHYESMSDSEKGDHRVSRNLSEWFWEAVKDERVKFPVVPREGKWIAVEKMPKPSYRTPYESTPVGARLGFRDRVNVSWIDAKAAIDRENGKLVSDIGLRRGANIRMLEALEWNLTANREGWGKTDIYEWTNTEYRGSGSRRLIVGGSDGGGAADASWDSSDLSDDLIGFRVAIDLGT